jgi:hypothetical protein
VNNASIILFIVGMVVSIFSFCLKMSNFLDVRSIFFEHFRVFKGNPLQLVSIFFVPVLFSISILNVHCVNNEILNNLNIVLSILIAMFFSTLSILCAFADRDNKNSSYKKLLKETFNATIFEALICLLLLFISFVTLFIGEFKQSLYLEIISGIIYYLAIVAVLNILVIIKRLKVLFENK